MVSATRTLKQYILSVRTQEPAGNFTVESNLIRELGEAINHAEDAVNDYLPDGYYCKIEEA